MLAACSKNDLEDEDLLWSYYSGFTYPPTLFDSLGALAESSDTRGFLEGLRCFEKYSQFENLECYDSALRFFQDIRRTSPESYLGNLGMGLLYTESAMAGDTLAANGFAQAAAHYDSAMKKAPRHAAVYYYAARNLYNSDKSSFHRRVISLLDTATQIHPGFAKALERQAEYLSHYLDLEAGGKVDSVRFYFPNIEIQIKHYFSESLKYDSSWFQTYAGIARSYRVYSTRERIDFLKKGLAIARAQKSPEFRRLAKSLADIYFFELADYETTINAEKSTSDAEGSYADERENYHNLAWAHFYTNDLDRAEAYFKRNTEQAAGGGCRDAWLDKSEFHLLKFQYESALQAADQAISCEPQNPYRAMILKARVYFETGGGEKARAILLQAKSLAEKEYAGSLDGFQEYEKIVSFIEALK